MSRTATIPAHLRDDYRNLTRVHHYRKDEALRMLGLQETAP